MRVADLCKLAFTAGRESHPASEVCGKEGPTKWEDSLSRSDIHAVDVVTLSNHVSIDAVDVVTYANIYLSPPLVNHFDTPTPNMYNNIQEGYLP